MLKKCFVVCLLSIVLAGCGFRLQGDVTLAPPLQRLALITPDPYGQLARNLQQALKMSQVTLVDSTTATTILNITKDEATQEFLSVNGTTQTRQYNLRVTVEFDITDANGAVIMPSLALSETRVITVQSNQILGSSNEANLFYQQMRRNLAYAIMNRIASKEVTQQINAYFANRTTRKKS
jgi:LPS-assembly lipoprotein